MIGNDGSLLGVDVVDGGYGYRFPPQIDIVDLEGLGSGAVAIASLCPPDKVGTLQTFEDEDDFEEYDFRIVLLLRSILVEELLMVKI